MKREDEDEPESALKKRKVPEVSRATGRRILAALRKAESHAGRHPPGSLLLAQDPVDLNRRDLHQHAEPIELPAATAHVL